MTVSHVVTSNGRARQEILSELGAERIIRHQPSLLDGSEWFSMSLSRLPEGKRLWDRLPVTWDDHFIQSAGTSAAMMIEVKLAGADGVDRLYAIGRQPLATDSLGEVAVRWRDRVDTVPSNEVFDASEAGELFWYYYEHGTVPDQYLLRDLDF